MRLRTSYSISSIVLLTTLVACCVYFVNRRLNPSLPELFQNLLAKIPPDGQVMLQKPATAQELDAADNAIAARLPGAKLPDNIKKLYALCGGQPWGTHSNNYLFPTFTLNPLQKATADYQEFCSLYDFHVRPSETTVFPETWYDYRLFPFGWQIGSGACYCVDVETERIYSFDSDGGIAFKEYDSVRELLEKSLDYQRKELGR